ncbi:hypothetical protein BGZ58_010587 [Dissophora ornata]|nr:hypothetical protein BGZ58_010587 [Dissophora ornata]
MRLSNGSRESASRNDNNAATSASEISQYSSYESLFTNHQKSATFKVLIVGAGIGGLLLGLCLEKANIDYVILERDQRPEIPKATFQLTFNTLYSIEQLGLLDEVMAISKPVAQIALRKHNLSVIGKIDCLYFKERYGHYSYVVQRTEFCQLLIARMRPDRILWGLKVLETVSGDMGVQCRCANGHVEQGDILVGADGAHSAVRQNLYRTLREKNLLPKVDQESMKFTQNAVIGLTNPLDLSRFPEAGAEFAQVHIVVGKESPLTMWLSPTSGNKVNWSVTGPLLTSNRSEENFMVSQFGPEEIDKTCRLLEHLQIPYGGTLADLIANTPRDCITKFLVEEKFVSFSGQGAEQAILDAVTLANLLEKIPSPYTLSDITESFKEFQEQRLPSIKAARASSGQVTNMINSQGLGVEIMRKIVFNLPTWVQAVSIDKAQARPSLDYLPAVQLRGTKTIRSPSSKRDGLTKHSTVSSLML